MRIVKARTRDPVTGRILNHTVGACNHCDCEVELTGFTNTCECGTDYNGAGQELAPREQWGEETGESVSDILAADTDPWGGDS